MTPKRGQPPKPPEEVKDVKKSVSFNAGQIASVEAARDKESPKKRIGAYIRDVVVDHAEKVNRKK